MVISYTIKEKNIPFNLINNIKWTKRESILQQKKLFKLLICRNFYIFVANKQLIKIKWKTN